MNTLDTNLNNNDISIDYTHKINTSELYNWIYHLKNIKKEIKNIFKLLEQPIKPLVLKESILEKLVKKNLENNKLLSILNNYAKTRENIIECEDLHCDMIFINEHKNCRKNYLYHLENYTNLKNKIYNKIENKNKIS